jgi:hypothetical protein
LPRAVKQSVGVIMPGYEARLASFVAWMTFGDVSGDTMIWPPTSASLAYISLIQNCSSSNLRNRAEPSGQFGDALKGIRRIQRHFDRRNAAFNQNFTDALNFVWLYAPQNYDDFSMHRHAALADVPPQARLGSLRSHQGLMQQHQRGRALWNIDHIV